MIARSVRKVPSMVRKSLTRDELDRADEKSRKRKLARDRMLAGKTVEKGLLIVHTGKGKGKSTAAIGLAARAVGNGMNVGIVQYVKGQVGNRRTRRAGVVSRSGHHPHDGRGIHLGNPGSGAGHRCGRERLGRFPGR